jgi:hypothetical protein
MPALDSAPVEKLLRRFGNDPAYGQLSFLAKRLGVRVPTCRDRFRLSAEVTRSSSQTPQIRWLALF